MPIVFNVKIAICLIFTSATLACYFTNNHSVYASPPVQGGMHA